MVTPLEVSRPELAWAIAACLPHAGTKAQGLDWVGFASRPGELHVYALDKYTAVKAVVEVHSAPGGLSEHHLPVSEAKDLLRYIKPTLVKHKDEAVQMVFKGPELHALVPGADSEVYDTTESEVGLIHICNLLQQTKPLTTYDQETQLVFKPEIFARFAKATRLETDRLSIYPKRGKLFGTAYVTVGDRFEGAIAGFVYEKAEEEAA